MIWLLCISFPSHPIVWYRVLRNVYLSINMFFFLRLLFPWNWRIYDKITDDRFTGMPLSCLDIIHLLIQRSFVIHKELHYLQCSMLQFPSRQDWLCIQSRSLILTLQEPWITYFTLSLLAFAGTVTLIYCLHLWFYMIFIS